MQYRTQARTLKNGATRYYPQCKTGAGWVCWERFETMGIRHPNKITRSLISFPTQEQAALFLARKMSEQQDVV